MPSIDLSWDGDRLKLSSKLTGYTVVHDQRYPTMWRARCPDGGTSDMTNRTRAKDAAMAILDRVRLRTQRA